MSSVCSHCNEPIKGQIITALGKKWHPEHFACAQCQRPFGKGEFYHKDGIPYCEEHYQSTFFPRCAQCSQPISGTVVNALGSSWHPNHFQCTTCKKVLDSKSFYESGGRAYCNIHIHSQQGTNCAGCGKPITGKWLTALGKKYHEEHFVCSFCMNPIGTAPFQERDGKAYCTGCGPSLFRQI